MNKRYFSTESIENPNNETLNLTPLIDVVFVVLIMFILLAPMVEIDKISLAPASKEKKYDRFSHEETNKIQIHVYANNDTYLNGSLVTTDELIEKLRKMHKISPKIQPQIYQDYSAKFGTYQTVKNAVAGPILAVY